MITVGFSRLDETKPSDLFRPFRVGHANSLPPAPPPPTHTHNAQKLMKVLAA